MATAEQPLKKRKLYDPPSEPPSQPPLPQSPSEPQPPPPPPPLQIIHPNLSAPLLPQDEILRRRRNREEIRSLFDCYKRIKFCVAHKDDSRLMPELEQAYLSLITASRGCTSVQCIVADLIPKYAKFCPTALEAAAKVVINMHNWSLALINKGEDIDGTALQTAKTCIFGLVDICHTASSEAPTSSVIKGICSAVFMSVITFFISSLEGKDIFQIVDKDILKIQDSSDLFTDFKEKFLNEDSTPLLKLSKFRALSFIRVFFCFPNNSLAACFELFESTTKEGICGEGQYFLNQVTRKLDADDARRPTDNSSAEMEVRSPFVKNCLLGLVLTKDPSLRTWIFLRYKKLRQSASPQVVSEIASVLEGAFESFAEQVEAKDSQIVTENDDLDSSKYIGGHYSVPKISTQQTNSSYVYEREGSLKPCISVFHLETDLRSNTSPRIESGDLSRTTRSSTPVARKWVDFRSNSFDGRATHFVHVDANQVPNSILSSPSLNGSFDSPKHQIYPLVWYHDGDPRCMDIFSASREIWVGSLGPDASEPALRFHFEKFGPIDQFIYIQLKGFAIVEYRYIMDAVKAREVLRRNSNSSSPWGSCPRIKFLDSGLGTRGATNGVAIGSTCHVYIGNIHNQWAKDEILHEIHKVAFKGPRMVADLTNEGALLMEFDSPEEATSVMVYLRQFRKENNNCLSSLIMSLRSKYNIPLNYQAGSMREEDRASTCNLWINIPNTGPSFLTDDELMAVCNLGVSNFGLVVRLTRKNVPIGSCWFVECNSIDAANALLKNLRSCPGNFMEIEFSHTVNNHGALTSKPESNTTELPSPRISLENHGPVVQGAQTFQSTWSAFGARQMDGHDNSLAADLAQGGNHGVSSAAEQMWMHSTPIQGPTILPPQQMQPSPFMRPVYMPPQNSSWDPHGLSNHQYPPLNPISPNMMSNNIHSNPVAPPFLPVSVTPLAPMFPMPPGPPPLTTLPPPLTTLPPPQPDFRPPQPSSPPPLPQSQPPLVPPPPPPSSPPPPPPTEESSRLENLGQCLAYQWQGTLSKSGVHYCTISASRLDSDICKYSNHAISEPIGWPAKLDMTKRTDFRHVKSTFTNTPSHRREVCQLLPSSAGDQKGLQDFISYLKQRECAGVIKVPAVKSVWSRLLFILPYSPEICSMLSVSPSQSDCLIAVILPKETNSE